MKKLKNIAKGVFVGSLLITVGQVNAQQISIFNNNVINPFSLNPSKVGADGSRLFFQHRNELVGVDGAPELTMLTAEFRPSDSKSAVGFQFAHETANIINNTSAFVTYGSHFKLNDKQSLSFGISAGIRHNAIAFDRVNVLETGDRILFDFNQATTNFDGNFGINYRFQKLDVQFSINQLFGNKATYFNTFEQKELNYQFVRHYAASIGYQFLADKKISVQPIVQIRGAEGLPVLPEFILKADFEDLFWLAGHYRNNASWAATAGVSINERYTVGYSAEFSVNEFSAHNSGTHEIIFGIKLNKQSRSGASSGTIKNLERSSRSYEERLEYLNQQNKKMEKDLEKQREKFEEMERNSAGKPLNYEEIQRMIDQASEANVYKLSNEELKLLEEEKKLKAELIKFEFGSDQLKSSSNNSLDRIFATLEANLSLKLRVYGHADNQGGVSVNDKLSQRRAEAVKAYLVQKGIDSNRIIAEGYGEMRPIADNKTAAGRAKNRRVEVKLEL